MPSLHLTEEPEADALLSRDPFALLVGMLLDQQIRMETAFLGPQRILERLPGPAADRLDPARLAELSDEDLSRIMAGPPAVHRYHASMGARLVALAKTVRDDYAGDAANLWRDADDGAELLRRVRSLPGFGEQKARIFVALLGKQWEVRPEGWREAAGEYGEDGVHRSIADVVDSESVTKVREFKQMRKAAARM